MVITFVKKSIVFVFVNIFFIRCYAVNENENKYLLFENLLEEKVLPVDLSIVSENILTDSVLLDKRKMIYPPKSLKIVGGMFDFLCDFNLINGWDSYVDINGNSYLNEFEKFVESRKSDLNFYYIGKIVISKEFESFIILSIDGQDDEYNWVRNLYLMNVSDNKCRSLTKLSCYSCFDGECLYLYTERTANEFILREENSYHNKLVTDDISIDSSLVRFMYDKRGMVKILNICGEN